MIEIKENKVTFEQIHMALERINDCYLFNEDIVKLFKCAIECLYAAGNVKLILSDNTIDDKEKLVRIKSVSNNDLKNYDWEEGL